MTKPNEDENAILDEHHVLVCGITGGGKSHWLKNYLARRGPVIKLDTKGEALKDIIDGISPWPQVHDSMLAVLTDFDALKQHNFTKRPYAIYVPDFDELDEPGHFNEVFKWIYFTFQKRGGVKVWIDELMEVVTSPHSIDKYLKAILTKGRFFEITAWMATQEPRHIHSLCMSQPTHLVTFDLTRKDDRKRLADNTGANEFMELPAGYNFWYFRRGWRNAVKGVIK